MKKLKAFVSSLFVTALSLSFVACSSGDTEKSEAGKDVDPKVRQTISENVKSSELLTGELENKTIKWLAEWDINADGNKSTPAFLVAFQERYGGNIGFGIAGGKRRRNGAA